MPRLFEAEPFHVTAACPECGKPIKADLTKESALYAVCHSHPAHVSLWRTVLAPSMYRLAMRARQRYDLPRMPNHMPRVASTSAAALAATVEDASPRAQMAAQSLIALGYPHDVAWKNIAPFAHSPLDTTDILRQALQSITR